VATTVTSWTRGWQVTHNRTVWVMHNRAVDHNVVMHNRTRRRAHEVMYHRWVNHRADRYHRMGATCIATTTISGNCLGRQTATNEQTADEQHFEFIQHDTFLMLD
jgi:hypothetical protein